MLEPEFENSRVRLNGQVPSRCGPISYKDLGIPSPCLPVFACTAEGMNQKKESFVIPSADINLENIVERSRCTRRVGRTEPKRLL